MMFFPLDGENREKYHRGTEKNEKKVSDGIPGSESEEKVKDIGGLRPQGLQSP